MSLDSVSLPVPGIWTLELIKQRIATGKRLTGCVVDIGNKMLVKHGSHYRVSREEGSATQFVAKWTTIPVPKIYADLHNETETYIVQEKLPGTLLVDLLPTMEPAACATLATELKSILLELAALDTRGPMGLFGRPSKFGDAMLRNFSQYDPDGKITTTEEYVHWIPRQAGLVYGHRDKMPPPGAFDFSRPPIFSHGDFVPENILVLDGHVSGIIDWGCAGWYPYFWNDYIARWRQNMPHFRDGKWLRMVDIMMEPFPKEFKAFDDLYSYASRFL
ncbi:kinase-like protein [Mycena galericulata]|nr:kinase-like protein [Mycena galericulata]